MKPDIYQEYVRFGKDEEWRAHRVRNLRNRQIRDGIVRALLEFGQATAVYWFIKVATQHGQGIIASGIVFFYALLALGGLCREKRLLDVLRVQNKRAVETDGQDEQVQNLLLRDLDALQKSDETIIHVSTVSKILLAAYAAIMFARL